MALGDYQKTTYVNGEAPGLSAERLNNNEDKTAELDQSVNLHLADITKHVIKDGTLQTGLNVEQLDGYHLDDIKRKIRMEVL